jgi:hypothetical protein
MKTDLRELTTNFLSCTPKRAQTEQSNPHASQFFGRIREGGAPLVAGCTETRRRGALPCACPVQ